MRVGKSLVMMSVLLAASACEFKTVSENDDDAPANQVAAPAQPSPQEQARQAQLQQARMQARQELQDLHFLVDISDRELRLMQGARLMGTHPVAVGTEKWPTPTGEWQLHRVDINPEWIPPKEEEWAEEEEAKAPGDPENPMGKARLVYRMPNTIHGTDDLNSLGKASSHGSIRVANDVVVQLAEMLLKAGGSWDGPQWYQQMLQNSGNEYQIELQNPVPIKVQD